MTNINLFIIVSNLYGLGFLKPLAQLNKRIKLNLVLVDLVINNILKVDKMLKSIFMKSIKIQKK